MNWLIETYKLADLVADWTKVIIVVILALLGYSLIESGKIPQEILKKFGSGRFILTLVGGAVFFYAVFNKILEPQATSAILTAIFLSYFQRSDRTPPNGEQH